MDESIIVKVDNKGRLSLPKEIRKQIGDGKRFIVTIEDKKVILEPVDKLIAKLSDGRTIEVD